MTRKFCDLCGEPARETTPSGKFKVGESYRAAKCRSGSSGVVEGFYQREIRTNVDFWDADKEHGADGHPDLCTVCVIKILESMIDQIKK